MPTTVVAPWVPHLDSVQLAHESIKVVPFDRRPEPKRRPKTTPAHLQTNGAHGGDPGVAPLERGFCQVRDVDLCMMIY